VKTKHDFRSLLALGLAAACAATPASALAAESTYDPLKTFAPLTLPDPVNRMRSGNGAPGADYWQNGADYEIHANLDTAAKLLSADETITYTNNSPDALESLWIQLDQNIYRKDARSIEASGRERTQFTEGSVLDSVETDSKGRRATADYLVSDTRMQIELPQPLKAHGGKLHIHIRYHYTIPGTFGGRTSWVATLKGEIYDIAQWYPRMCVYDDLRGWDTLPYLGNEFYLEYGHFDYYVTVPSGMLVAGSGELKNPREVLTKTAQQRLEAARTSDRTVVIRSAEEVAQGSSAGEGAARSGTLTWHYHMDKTRDVAFSASSAFVWDAARINLPDGARSPCRSIRWKAAEMRRGGAPRNT